MFLEIFDLVTRILHIFSGYRNSYILADSRPYHSILHENLDDFTLQYTHGSFMHYIHFVRLLYIQLNHIVMEL